MLFSCFIFCCDFDFLFHLETYMDLSSPRIVKGSDGLNRSGQAAPNNGYFPALAVLAINSWLLSGLNIETTTNWTNLTLCPGLLRKTKS
jgi:hypothetical protein